MLYEILFVLDTILFLIMVASIFSYYTYKRLSKSHICIIFYAIIHVLSLLEHLFDNL